MSGHTINRGLPDPELFALAQAKLHEASHKKSAQDLASEMFAIQTARKMPVGLVYDARRSVDGRPVFIVSCDNGYHESFDGFEEALRDLLDAHRTRVEDLETTHIAMATKLGVTVKEARRIVAKQANEARREQPDITDEQLLARLAR